MTKLKLLPDYLRAAVALFPELSLLPEGSFWDRYGIDGYIGNDSIQCKHDRRIAASGNIWHEIYEKSAFNDAQPWRKSPGIAALYIFTTEETYSYTGYLVSVNVLASLENGMMLKTIYPNGGAATSMGFLIPVSEIVTRSEVRTATKSYDNNGG